MNQDYETSLAAEIDRELKRLPELSAPTTFASRVMEAIEPSSATRWYRQPWQLWPAGWQLASFVLLAALAGGVSFGGWEALRSSAATNLAHQVSGWFSGFSVIWETLLAILQAIVLAVKKLGFGFMVACLTLAAFSYLACVGLGTVFVRYAFSRR